MDKAVVDLLNEIGMLAATPRSGFAFLGSGSQSVAEHSYRAAVVGMALADQVDEEVDREKLLSPCRFHELLLVLKQLYDTGNPRAEQWFGRGRERLQSSAAKAMAAAIWDTPSDNWWFQD